MEIYGDIPIVDSLYSDTKLYHYLCSAFYQLLYCEVNFNAGEESKCKVTNYWNPLLKKAEYTETLEKMRGDTRTMRNLFRVRPSCLEGDFVVWMPRDVWEMVEKKLLELPFAARNSVTRVFIYLYYWSMRFQGSYSHDRENMVKELHMNRNTLANSIQWLEAHELIVRTEYSKRADNSYARRYYIPEMLWTDRCRYEVEQIKRTAIGEKDRQDGKTIL